MTDSFPFLFAFVITVGFFVLAMTRGVVSMLSSATAFAIAIAVFFAFVQFIPDLASKLADIDLKWKALMGVAGGAALVVFIIVRLIVGWIFKSLLGPDGPLHAFSDGFAGGVLSLFPSLVIILFLFTCIRISGTLHELNYAASLSRDGIAQAADQIPSYPWTSSWRQGVENIPLMAPVLDLMDPFSNRANRNAAAFSIMNQSSLIRAHLLSQPDSAELAANQKIISMNRESALLRHLESHDRVALVMSSKVREIASDPELHSDLQSMGLGPILISYVTYLKGSNPSEPVSAAN